MSYSTFDQNLQDCQLLMSKIQAMLDLELNRLSSIDVLVRGQDDKYRLEFIKSVIKDMHRELTDGFS